MAIGKGIQMKQLPIQFKLSAKLERQANLVGTGTTYTAEMLDETKRTVLLKFKNGNNAAVVKFAEMNRNIKNGDWIVLD